VYVRSPPKTPRQKDRRIRNVPVPTGVASFGTITTCRESESEREDEEDTVRHRTTLLFLPVCATLLVLALSACSFSASSANISSAEMARDQDGEQPTQTFSPDEPFYCIVELSNAPDDTTLRAVWTAVKVEGADADTKIDEAKTTSGSGQLQFNLSNDGPWPTGDYKVDLYLNDAEEPTKTLEFEVQ
jgi:hypothetical protein